MRLFEGITERIEAVACPICNAAPGESCADTEHSTSTVVNEVFVHFARWGAMYEAEDA